MLHRSSRAAAWPAGYAHMQRQHHGRCQKLASTNFLVKYQMTRHRPPQCILQQQATGAGSITCIQHSCHCNASTAPHSLSDVSIQLRLGRHCSRSFQPNSRSTKQKQMATCIAGIGCMPARHTHNVMRVCPLIVSCTVWTPLVYPGQCRSGRRPEQQLSPMRRCSETLGSPTCPYGLAAAWHVSVQTHKAAACCTAGPHQVCKVLRTQLGSLQRWHKVHSLLHSTPTRHQVCTVSQGKAAWQPNAADMCRSNRVPPRPVCCRSTSLVSMSARTAKAPEANGKVMRLRR